MNKNKETSGSMAFAVAFAFAFDLACACTGSTSNRAAARPLPFCKGRDASYRPVHDVLLLLVLFSFARGHKHLFTSGVLFPDRCNYCLGFRRSKSLNVTHSHQTDFSSWEELPDLI